MLDASHAEGIADEFRLGDEPAMTGPVARGEQAQVWRLVTTAGTWAVKESFLPEEADAGDLTARFQERARADGVPTPPVRRTVDGSPVHRVDGLEVHVYGWVELRPADALLDPATVGEIVARVHRVHEPATGPVDPWHTQPLGEARWRALARQVRTRSAPFAELLEDSLPALLEVERVLTPMRAVQTCHLDLWADNLRASTTGELCVLDWENAGPGDPSREVALVLFEFARTDPRRMRELYAAYVAAGGPGRVRRPEDFALAVAQLGHLGERHLVAWLDPASSTGRREHAAEGILEMLEEPLTMAVIEAILDAISSVADG